MTDRELATVLAALRLWQAKDRGPSWDELLEIANDARPMLNDNEIDQLCEKLNTIPLEWTQEETQEREA